MPFGPIEILCIKFPETAISEAIALALKALVDRQMIRIVSICPQDSVGGYSTTSSQIWDAGIL